jgi:hypothetical protein
MALRCVPISRQPQRVILVEVRERPYFAVVWAALLTEGRRIMVRLRGETGDG